MEQLREHVRFDEAEFTEEDGIKKIRNVVLLGRVSSNGYEYSPSAMKEAVSEGLYDNVRVFVNHSEGSRSVMDLAGCVESARFDQDRVKGDVRLLPDDHGEKVWAIAQTMPDAAGFSHVADGKIDTVDGRRVVTQIRNVFSVDCVSNPATTHGMFEGEGETLEESLPKPGPKELQYQFIPRCIHEVKAANATLTDEEAGAMCFTVWQARYEPGGMMDTDPVPATATAKESSTINDSKIIESGPKPGKDSSMSESSSFIDDLNKTITAGKRIATVAHPLAADLVHQTVQEDDDKRIAARVAEKAATAAKLPEVLEKCRDIGDGLAFRESDRDFAARWNGERQLCEQRGQDRQTAKSIASSIATLGV